MSEAYTVSLPDDVIEQVVFKACNLSWLVVDHKWSQVMTCQLEKTVRSILEVAEARPQVLGQLIAKAFSEQSVS